MFGLIVRGSRNNRVRSFNRMGLGSRANRNLCFILARRYIVNGNSAGEFLGLLSDPFKRRRSTDHFRIARQVCTFWSAVPVADHIYFLKAIFGEEDMLVTTILQMVWIPTKTTCKLCIDILYVLMWNLRHIWKLFAASMINIWIIYRFHIILDSYTWTTPCLFDPPNFGASHWLQVKSFAKLNCFFSFSAFLWLQLCRSIGKIGENSLPKFNIAPWK